MDPDQFLAQHRRMHRRSRLGAEHYLVLAILASVALVALVTMYWRLA